ncbi:MULTISPECIES: ABC transporter substrate-binding protein [Haloarcula]|uniref:ABC transporter substrate-binding protein n=1 Tax=Haloarcula pellucida TaxID=1427151 RepID=A0A830GLP5_9EURY|nr:sugar ABC transporter substrate-binding protein [Halomicroarcula pellucida]MBX0349721.1 sugar ABC transporter substrate-binding protein [Halomicroarcula pellucida]QIO24555.1 sugar ABC transporter substrate-binding protein [Haloarcula sp. JP-L23]GGN93991.1 ABC transporter substrate-binding protein [Halomicroarcula pellucida]
MQPDNNPESSDDSIDRRQLLQALGAGGAIAIAGCSGDGGSGSDGGDGDSGSGSDGGDGGTQSVQFLTMGVGDNIKQFFEENNAAFEEEHGVDVEFTSVTWDNARQTVNNRVDGGQAPDVSRWPARWIPQLVGKDALEPLDDMMDGEFGEQFYDGVAEGTMYNGSHYGVPWAASNKCLYYNKDVFETAGLDPENPSLDSWQDMVDAAKQIRDSDASVPALGLAGADAIETGSQYYHYHWSHGADLVDDEGMPVVNSSGAVDALSLYTDLHLEHDVTQSSPLSSTRQDIRQLFENGDLGMVIGHVYTGLNITSAQENDEVDFDYGIVQVPRGPEGRYSLFTIDTLAILSQSEHKDLARDLIRFYFDEERRFQYSKQKGFLPVVEAVGERSYFSDSKNWGPFVEAGQYARARPKLSNFSEFNDRMVQAIQEALAERKTPQKALNDAQSDLEDAME